MATWLYICAGISWAGCGMVQSMNYGTEEACNAALSRMVVTTNGQSATGGNGRQVIAVCRPKPSWE